ncbi:unnamed protein product [Urochloa humidicola]
MRPTDLGGPGRGWCQATAWGQLRRALNSYCRLPTRLARSLELDDPIPSGCGAPDPSLFRPPVLPGQGSRYRPDLPARAPDTAQVATRARCLPSLPGFGDGVSSHAGCPASSNPSE